jgi:hypothetical protein
VTGGLGTADPGGAWTVSAGAARQSVANGTATFATTAGTNTGSFLGTVATDGVDVRTTVSLSSVPTGGGATVYVTGRRVTAANDYRGRVRILADGSVRLSVVRFANSTEALIGSEVLVPGLTYTAGKELELRVTVSGTGTTALTATLWAAGSAEPATPTISRTDTTAGLQAPGSVGLTAYLSASATAPVGVRFTGFTAREIA